MVSPIYCVGDTIVYHWDRGVFLWQYITVPTCLDIEIAWTWMKECQAVLSQYWHSTFAGQRINDLEQDCSNSTANALELPQSFATPSAHYDTGCMKATTKQRVLMHGHQGWNVRHGLCHIYMIYVYIWVVHSFCLFCCLFIIVTTQFVAPYEPCKPKPKPKPSTYDIRTTTPWQRSKFRYLDRSQSNKYAINMQIQTISVSK